MNAADTITTGRRKSTAMYKEIAFSTEQQGFGLAFTDPSTGIRNLVGIFTTYEEAFQKGQAGSKQALMLRPEVVPWNKTTYDEYKWVYQK